ncbi:podoplanin [Erinaceus europaeus]|uniref:Podoplanin n=1 Tax=Erinaceus europaeus TaxID=9365 RepID=A0ABM3YB47_ERIEU|nr:podoplanin [Erinaceus europaeus]
MWKIAVLLFVLGSSSLWVGAEGASTVRPEDDITTAGVEDDIVTTGDEDDIVTLAASDEPYETTSLASLVPTTAESITRREDLPTTGQEGIQSSTTLNVVTSNSVEKVSEETETKVEKDGLATVTLIGIIVGVLLAIGFVGGIIFVVLRKMSGRYSP